MPDEEEEQRQLLTTLQTRLRIMNWGDHSTLSGHGYLLYCVTPLFDPAVLAHPQQSSTQVQRQVERPHIYILAQSADTSEDKLMYIQERLLDIQQLDLPLQVEGLPDMYAELRGFKGDNPEQQWEIGVNQSGFYKCSGCDAHTEGFFNLATTYSQPRISYQTRQATATAGVFGKQPSLTRPLAKLSKRELIRELTARRLPTRGMKVKELKQTLREALQGTQRVPSLLSRRPTEVIADTNLASYEVFSSEGFHDAKEHVKNVLTELPHHLDAQSRVIFDGFIASEIGALSLARGSDYRKAAMKVPTLLRGKVSEDVQALVDTLAEICLHL